MSFSRLAAATICAAAVLVGVSSFAQTTNPGAPTTRAWSAPVVTDSFENDAFTGTDAHYAHGVKFSWLAADLAEWGQTGWRKQTIEMLPFINRPDGQKNIGLAFSQNIYTPQNIEVTNPLDRPYAGWSYLELAFVSKTEDVSDTISLQLGVVGPHSLSEDSQRIVHKWVGSPRPRGWDYQLRDEVGGNLIYERGWRLYGRALSQTLGIDLVPHAIVSLGNVRAYANGGATLRLGLDLPSDFGVPLARAGSIGDTPTDDLDPRVAFNRNFSLFIFGGADGRAVARDIFLDGNTFRKSRSVEREYLVAALSAGVGLIAGRQQMTDTQVWRTKEFKTQRGNYNNFVSVTFSRTL